MAKKLVTQCEHCKDWFETRMIGGPNIAEMFLSGAIKISNSKESCPHCGKMTTIDNSTLKTI